MDNSYAGRDRFLKVGVVGTRTSVEGKRYGYGRSDLADAVNIKPLFHAAADHALEQPVHIPAAGARNVDSRNLDKAFSVVGLRQKTRALRHAFVDLRAAADETELSLEMIRGLIDLTTSTASWVSSMFFSSGKVETSKPIYRSRLFERMFQGMGVIGIEGDWLAGLLA